MRIAVIGTLLQRGVEIFDGFGRIAFMGGQYAQTIQDAGRVGVNAERFRKFRFRFLDFALGI